jgi:hypothetical protein
LLAALDDVFFFLPHVHRVLFPETIGLARGSLRDRADSAHELLKKCPARIAKGIPAESALRLTYNMSRLGEMARATLVYDRTDEDGRLERVMNSTENGGRPFEASRC